MTHKRPGYQHSKKDHKASEVKCGPAPQDESWYFQQSFRFVFPLDLKSQTKASVLLEDFQSSFGNCKQR